jgi:hypothetical protein
MAGLRLARWRGGEEPGEFFGGCLPAEGLAGAAVELGGDSVQVLCAVVAQARALGEVLAQQPVDASMSSGEPVAGYLVLPGGLVGGHRAVDDVG